VYTGQHSSNFYNGHERQCWKQWWCAQPSCRISYVRNRLHDVQNSLLCGL